ncbi:FAR-17a/AIG1-like protein [Dipodascopsis tothii]|uniref:FAR-17a/AIG1-like protein n=1 Tax=Dipodascopsis tothii TaxID=44089 RepID=UPI0034CF30CC
MSLPVYTRPPALSSSVTVMYAAGAYSFFINYQKVAAQIQGLTGVPGTQFQYLTVIALLASLVIQVLAVSAVVLDYTAIWRVKNELLCYVAPLELLVSVVYWSVMLYDRNLMIPPGLDPSRMLSLWTDLSIHLVPTLFLVSDFLLYSPRPTTKPLIHLGVCIALAQVYWTILHRVHAITNSYPYPFLELASQMLRVVIFCAGAGMVSAFYLALRRAYVVLHGR